MAYEHKLEAHRFYYKCAKCLLVGEDKDLMTEIQCKKKPCEFCGVRSRRGTALLGNKVICIRCIRAGNSPVLMDRPNLFHE
jgi:hypothetical protein